MPIEHGVARPPIYLFFFQLFVQSIDDDFISSLGLPVALWICESGISVFYAQPITIPPKGFTIKLKVVVRCVSIWDFKSCNNIRSHKLLHAQISDVGKRLGFDPFGETVSCNK